MTAEILRRAAALMRERAGVATPGPWSFGEFVSPKLGDHRVVYRVDKDEQGKNWQVATIYGFPNPGVPDDADAAHIASWHPDVASLAALAFEQHAEVHDSYDCVHEPCAHVLAARAYLGEAS